MRERAEKREVCGFDCRRAGWVTWCAAARQTGAVGLATSQEVRRVLYGGDGAAAFSVARSLGLGGPLQQVGDLVLLALDYDVAQAGEFAAECCDALRARGWDGDQELADAIEATRGMPPSVAASLKELPVDLEQLADLIDGGPDSAGGRLDLTSGEIWLDSVFDDSDDLDEDDDDPDRWLYVWPEGSRRAYNDMVDFIATRESRALTARLERALEGRGAFRRFKDTLLDWPEDREDWFVFSEDRRRGRAREWLADAGYRPTVHRNPSKPTESLP